LYFKRYWLGVHLHFPHLNRDRFRKSSDGIVFVEKHLVIVFFQDTVSDEKRQVGWV
jgi:hypothetical protein